MSTTTPLPEAERNELKQLHERVRQLGVTVATRTRRAEDRRSVYLAVGGLVTVLIAVSFTVLTNMAFRLDAEALTQIGRLHVEQRLPESREALTTYLKEKAPSLTSELLWALVGAIPELRPLVLRELSNELARLTAEFEKEVAEAAEASVRSARERLDARYPDLSEAEKLDRVVESVTQQFNEKVAVLYSELYPDYSREMQRVERYLTGLREKDPATLTDRERTEKEIIETLLRLVALEGVSPTTRDS